MFSSTSVGVPSAITRAASTRWLCRLVEFRTRMMASGRGVPGMLPGQHIHRNLLVFGLGRKAIDAGKVDERDFLTFGVAHVAGVMFDGDAGKIADLLAQAGEAIEERGLAGIRGADHGNGAIRCAERFVRGTRHRMAAHRRGSHGSVSKGRRPEQLHVDVARDIAAHGDFGRRRHGTPEDRRRDRCGRP